MTFGDIDLMLIEEQLIYVGIFASPHTKCDLFIVTLSMAYKKAITHPSHVLGPVHFI